MIDLDVSNRKDTKISSYSPSMHGVPRWVAFCIQFVVLRNAPQENNEILKYFQ